MHTLKNITRRFLLLALSVFIAGSFPLAASAQAVADESTDAVVAETPAPSEEVVPPKKTYTYDPDTGRWNSGDWTYNANTGTYETTPPSAPAPVVEDSSAASVGTDATSNSSIHNVLDSTAISGDASVNNNTSAGSATSGDAQAMATIFNSVISSFQGSNPEAATFVSDIFGDVYGDIMLYPSMIQELLSAINPIGSTTTATTNVNNSVGITNDVSLNAASGNATVSSNTSAGNATTGSANAMVNIINMINTIIASNKSFAGTINIYGNLDGDILVAPDFIPQLIASNGGTTPSSLDASITDTQSITNNVTLNAASGNASTTHNSTAGNATTGAANTNLVILNMTGHEVVASNSLLVFVNVLGSWVGLIVDAPAGATAAAFGNGITTNNILNNTLNAQSTSSITNNVDLNAQSGNATVANNSSAGSATSGNATAAANIVNISGTTLSLSDWFGLLFINVYGTWNGSFGVDTAAGNTPAPAAPSGTTNESNSSTGAPGIALQFIPAAAPAQMTVSSTSDVAGTTSDVTLPPPPSTPEPASDSAVLAAATTNYPANSTDSSALNSILLSAGLIGVGVALIAGKPLVSYMQAKRKGTIAQL